jgi:hypothetical protein
MKIQGRGVEVQLYYFFNLGVRGWVFNATPPAALTPVKPNYQLSYVNK